MSLLDRPDLDTPLARRLHAEGRLGLEALQAGLAGARAAAPPTTLARWLVARGALGAAEVEAHLARLVAPAPDSAGPLSAPAAADPAAAATAAPGPPGRARDPAPGQRVAGHVLGRRLGQGGMGAVFLAHHEATGAERAVKLLPAGADPELELRFVREAQAMARVDGHPHVVRVVDAGVEAGWRYLVMEKVDGGDLQGRLDREGPLPPAEAAALVEALAGALAHVHARGILHRDLKPANVLLDQDGRPRLTDFGLARLAGAEALTRTGGLLGTPAYMAPEQVDGAGVDERADVHGLGALLHALLTGRPPFEAAGGVAQVLKQVLGARPAPPSRSNPAVPPGLDAVVQRCLEKAPADRYPSAAAVAEALARWRRGEDAAPARRRARAAAGAGALGLLALGAAGARLAARPDGPRHAGPGGPGDPGAVASAAALAPTADPDATARTRYLERCRPDRARGDPAAVSRALAEVVAGWDAPRRERLRAAKAAALAADAAAWVRAADPPGGWGPATAAVEALAAVTASPPEVDPPPAVVGALAVAGDRRLAGAGAGDLAAVAAFELARARATGFVVRPTPALGAWVALRISEPHSDRSLDVVRLALWTDYEGLGRSLGPLEAGAGVPDEQLAAARAVAPWSRSLALLATERFLRTGEKAREVPAAAWDTALAAARQAGAEGPGDLGPRWALRARLNRAKLVYRRATRAGGALPEAARRALLEEAAAVAGAVREAHLARARAGPEPTDTFAGPVALPASSAELRDATEHEASALRLLGDPAASAAVWRTALPVFRPLGDSLDQQRERTRGLREAAVGVRLAAPDEGRALAEEALAFAEALDDARELRDAVSVVVEGHLDVAALRGGLAAADARLLRDHDRLRTWLDVEPGRQLEGVRLARLALRAAAALGDRPAFDARLALAREVLGGGPEAAGLEDVWAAEARPRPR